MSKSLITLDRVLQRVPYSKTEWYRGIQEGRFPKPFKRRPDKPESRGVCWREADIDEILKWIESEGRLIPSFACPDYSTQTE